MPSRIVCFVCGSLGGEFQLRSRPYEGCAFFPFLEHHDPPKGSRIPGPDGIVDSCRVCYAFLTQQWETYERTNTPAIKRLYWLKRLDDGHFTGAEMKLQGEYMAQVMGLQYQPSCGDGCAPHSPDSRDGSGTGLDTDVHANRKSQPHDDGERVLDLSVPIKFETSTKSSHKRHPSGDVSMREVKKTRPRFEEFSFICYTCGIENEGVTAKCISSIPHGGNEPFFPFLTKLPPPKAAVPLSSQGVCQVCDRCFSSLCHQWLTYEHHGTPNSARIFKVNAQFFSNDSNIALGVDNLSVSGEVCYLCSKSWSSSKVCSLYTSPTNGKGDQMYFPFIRELRRPPGARPLNPDGSVLVCVSCFSNLQDQWQRYEAEKVPLLQQRYSLLPPSSSSSITSSSLKSFADSDIKFDTGMIKSESLAKTLTQPLAIEISKSPPFAKNHGLPPAQPNHSSITAVAASASSSSTITTQETSRHQSIDVKSHISSTVLSIPHPLQQAGERPKKVCFLCGEKCLLSKAQVLYSYPVRHETKNSGGQSLTIPFFPFLASHQPAPGSEPMTEEGTVISCSYCFYSLLNQWRDFEESKGVTERNRWLRKYTLNEFVCYVCGMMVPRKKMRTLEVHKFLFLREHKAPPNALVMWGGEGVGACGSCHYSLSHQFTEFERLGLPMELRKYNWTVQHHTEENSSDAQDSSQGVLSAVVNEDSNLSVTEAAEDSNHSSPQTTKPVLNLISSASTFGKPLHKSALVLPQNQISPSNGLTSSGSNNNSRSFAAALRNLAHHAKEPSDDVSDHSLTSPTNHTSRSTTPKRIPISLVLPSHPATSSFTSPPVVTVAPTQTSMFQGIGSFSLSQDRSHISTFEQWSKPDLSQHPLSSDDSGLGGKDLLLSRTQARVSSQRSVSSVSMPVTSQALNLYARNFHAYRPEEEELLRHGLPLPYGMDPVAYAAVAYHPALLPQQAAFAQGSLRLGDSLLLDQYRMLQAPYLPFTAPGLISPHSLGLGMQTMLAAAAASQHYPPALYPHHYPYLNVGQPLMDPQVVAQAAVLDRSRLDTDKSRDKREKEKANQERTADKELNHQTTEIGELVKKDHIGSSDSFGKVSFERRDMPSVPICLSSQSPEILSRHFSESHNGHPSSRPNSSMSPAGGHRAVSKISPSTNDHLESFPDKPGLSLNLSNHHGLFKSQGTVSPTKGLTFKPYDRHHDSAHHTSSQLALDLHLSQGSSLPLLVRSSSFSNSTQEKSKTSSDFTPLFRPFEHNKQNVESSSTTSSGSTVHLKHNQWQLDNASSFSDLCNKEPHAGSSAPDLPLSFNDVNSRTSPRLTLTRDPTSVPKHSQLKQTTNCLSERIERFDFKSLACEFGSSSTHHRSSLNCSDVPAAEGPKEFLSKLDYEAAKSKQRRKRGEETDSDNEREEEEKMRVRLTMIGRTTPISLDTSPPKIDLLENLGLTTWKRKKEINRMKEIRRRRQLRLSSISPIQHELDSIHELYGDSANTDNHLKQHLSPDHQDTEYPDVPSYEINTAKKSEYFARLGLMPINEKQRAELEKRRKCLAKIIWTSSLQQSGNKLNSNSEALHGVKRKHSDTENLLNDKELNNGISDQKTDHPYESDGQLSNSNVAGHLLLTHDTVNKTKIFSHPETSRTHPSQQVDFLRLPGSNDHRSLPGSGSSSTLAGPLTPRNASSKPSNVVFPWPGIDAVVQSYQQHREEQLAETQELRERCRQLKAVHNDLEQVAQRVSRHMAYLMEEKQRATEERTVYQDAINHLKETFGSLAGHNTGC